ncbi:hypothetical protein [Endothiovibrio diazotrophicus]
MKQPTVLLMAALLIAGCQNPTRQETGMVVGGVLGTQMRSNRR